MKMCGYFLLPTLMASCAMASSSPSPSPEPTASPAPEPTQGPIQTRVRTFPGIELNYPIPNPLPAPAFSDGFQNTYYHMAFESDYPTTLPKDQEVLDMSGRVLAKVCEPFSKSLAMEGSGEIADGRVVNFAGRVEGKTRYHETKHAWGRAGGNCALKPFQSIAIDPTYVAQGSVVYIDETVGMKLPDGSIHNGVWYADDTGSAIQKARVDLYIGKKEWAKWLSLAGITHMKALTIRVLAKPAANSCLDDPPQ